MTYFNKNNLYTDIYNLKKKIPDLENLTNFISKYN